MNERQLNQSLIELREMFVDMSLALAQVARMHAGEPAGPEIADVWRIARLVLASALVEHQRLLGVDVVAAESQLRDHDSQPWCDLVAVSNDGETDEPTSGAAPIDTRARTEAPQLHLLQGEDSRLYVAVPLAADPDQLLIKGEST